MKSLHDNLTYRIAGDSLTIDPWLGYDDVVMVNVSPGTRIAYFDPSLWTVSEDDYAADQDIKYTQEDYVEEDPDLSSPEEKPDTPDNPEEGDGSETPDNPEGGEGTTPPADDPDRPLTPEEEEEKRKEEAEKKRLEKLRSDRMAWAYDNLGYDIDGISPRTYPVDGYSTRLSVPSNVQDDEQEGGESGYGNYTIYIRLDISSKRGLIVFSLDANKPALQYEDDASSTHAPMYAWIKIGRLFSIEEEKPEGGSPDAAGDDGLCGDDSTPKTRTVELDFGCLGTQKSQEKISEGSEWYVTDASKKLVDFRTNEDESFWLFNKFKSISYQLVDWSSAVLNAKIKKFVEIIGLRTAEDTTLNTDDKTLGTTAWAARKFLRKDKNDKTEYGLQLSLTQGNKTLQLGPHKLDVGTSGNGFKMVDGNGVLQVDTLKVLKKMEAKEVEIQEVNYIGGSQVLTPANGFTVIKVEELAFDKNEKPVVIKPAQPDATSLFTVQLHPAGTSQHEYYTKAPGERVASIDLTIKYGTSSSARDIPLTAYVMFDVDGNVVLDGDISLNVVGADVTIPAGSRVYVTSGDYYVFYDRPVTGVSPLVGTPVQQEGGSAVNGPVVGYRLYFENTDGERTIKNTWSAGDLAFCQRWDVSPGKTEDFATHYWWRRIIGRPSYGQDYIDVYDINGPDTKHPRKKKKPTADTPSEAAEGADSSLHIDGDGSGEGLEYYYFKDTFSDTPQVGDKVVMLGNFSNPDRQTAIIMSASQTGAPYFRMYKGIDTFNLADADCFINLSSDEVAIQADAIKLESEKTLTQTLDSLLESQKTIDDVSKQLDQSFLIHQSDSAVVPTLSNEPANAWTEEECAEHVGDFFINRDGLVWKFVLLSAPTANPPVFGWQPVSDEYLLSFIGRVDSKSTNFMTAPGEMPTGYRAGDLWVSATYGNYSNALLICVSTQQPGTDPDINDWKPVADFQSDAERYIEEMKKIAARYDVNADGKIETFFVATYEELQAQAAGWTTESARIDHVGDMGYVKNDKDLWEYTRWKENEDDDYYTYGWQLSYDAITKNVIETASQAKDTADGKRTTFIFQLGPDGLPIWPRGYSEGDLWAPVSYTFDYMENGVTKQVVYTNGILVCTGTGHPGSIVDWTGISIAKEELVKAGFMESKDFAKMYAQAVVGGVEVAGASIEALVKKDQETGEWRSNVKMEADQIIFNGQSTFLNNFKDAIQLEDTVKSLTAGKVDADPAAILTALNGRTTVAGGVIDTQYIDVKNLKVKHLEGADGTFDGFIQTKFADVMKVENVKGGFCVLSGDHCHLEVHNGQTYALPSSPNHAGKRITLLNMYRTAGTSVVKTENGQPILGYTSNDSDIVNKNNVLAIEFRLGILEFLGVPDTFSGQASCQWVCIANKAGVSFGTPGEAVQHTPKLLYYAFVKRNGDSLTIPNWKNYLDGEPKVTLEKFNSAKVVRFNFSECFPQGIDLNQCMISVTGAPGEGATTPTFACLGGYNFQAGWFEVHTGNRANSFTNGSFILRIDY